MKKTITSLLAAGVLAAAATPVLSAEYEVTVTNLTRGIYFTPLLVSAHNDSTRLFTSGQAASASLQAMAEGGSTTLLQDDLNAAGATVVDNPAGGPLAPAANTVATVNTGNNSDHTRLSVVAMMLPTNDGFIGLNAAQLPTEVNQSVTFDVPAYDAGTEANDETRRVGGEVPGVAGFPVPPFIASDVGTGGAGINATAEGYVHIHRNVLGDTDNTAGVSDINSVVHRWLNPVARVTVRLVSQ